jgi:putative Mg2+ transporter-C (MgtC) family protein
MEEIAAPTTVTAVVLRLGLAVLLGGAIGLNRELLRKPAGLQTHSLVSLGAALLAMISVQLSVSLGDEVAVSRVIQGLVAGVGFIGGGVILHRKDTQGVYGLTTAASIWVVAGLGTAMGLGLWRTSVAAVGLSLGILIVFGSIDHWLERHQIRVSPPHAGQNGTETPETQPPPAV